MLPSLTRLPLNNVGADMVLMVTVFAAMVIKSIFINFKLYNFYSIYNGLKIGGYGHGGYSRGYGKKFKRFHLMFS
jgi:hypothetical protein